MLCSFSCTKIFIFGTTGLLCFICPFISLAVIGFPSRTTILIGAFVAGTCDLVTFFMSVNAFGSWFAKFCK